MSDQRPVCRRCKKKRPLDEPLETARYRTCKPCREIERKKKRLKKLETLGKATNPRINDDEHDSQLQVQVSQDAVDIPKNNYSDEAILSIDNQVHRHLPPHIQQYDQQLSAPVLPPIKKSDEREIPIDELLLKEGHGEHEHEHDGSDSNSAAVAAAAVAAAANEVHNARTIQHPNRNITEEQLREQHQQQLAEGAVKQLENVTSSANDNDESDKNDETNLFAAIRAAENARAAADAADAAAAAVAAVATIENDTNSTSAGDLKGEDNVCLYCGATRNIEDNGRYQLCGNCVDNPLDTANVFDDFELFLNKVEVGQVSDSNNIVFIKKISSGSIADFKQNEDGSTNLDEIIVDLTAKFVDQVLEKSGFKFSRTSSNLSVKPQPKSIKLLFKCKQDIRTIQKHSLSSNPSSSNPAVTNSRRLKTEDCRSNVYISYDIYGKSLNIKFNHKTHKPFLEKVYSQGLIDKVKELERSIPDLNELYNYVKDNAFLNNVPDEDLRLEIGLLKKQNFVKDFSNF